MRKSRVAGLLLLATATLAQQQQTVEITSEPNHHLVFQNEYVRVFDVTVAPKTSTLIHRHTHDYLFVTLGDADLINARVGEKPVPLKLKDGDVRFTAGNFAHAAINESEQPFHNTTIELLKPSSNVKQFPLAEGESAVTHAETVAVSGQWRAWIYFLQPGARMNSRGPALFVAVSDLGLTVQSEGSTKTEKRPAGDVMWIRPDASYMAINGLRPAKFFLLEFNPEKPKP